MFPCGLCAGARVLFCSVLAQGFHFKICGPKARHPKRFVYQVQTATGIRIFCSDSVIVCI